MMDQQTESTDRRRKNTNTSVGETRVLLTALTGERGPPPGAAEEFFWLYSQFGKVEKISIFKKKKLQIFTQFSKPSECSRALSCLNGCCVEMFHSAQDGPYTFGLATLPSFLVEVTFSKTNSRNCDYTNENHSIEQSLREGVVPQKALDFLWGSHVKGEGWVVPKQPDGHRGIIPEGPGIPKGSKGECAYIAGLPGDLTPDQIFTVEQIYKIASLFGKVLCARKVKKGDGGTFLVQFDDKLSCSRFINFFSGMTISGKPLRVEESVYDNTMFWINSGAEEIQANIYTPREGDVRPPSLPEEFIEKMKITNWVGVQGVDESDGYKLIEKVLGREVDQSDVMDFVESSPTDAVASIAGPLDVVDVLHVIGAVNGQVVPESNKVAVAYFLQVPQSADPDHPITDLNLDDIDYDAYGGRSVTDVFTQDVDYPRYRATTQY